MYKKFFLSLLIVSMSFLWLSKADVQDVTLQYCDNPDPRAPLSRMFFVEPGSEKEICLQMTSDADKPVEVIYGFPNTIVNSQWDKTCSSDMSSWNSFSKFFVFSGEKKVVVRPGIPVKITERFLAPLWMSGEINWCFVYTLKELTTERKEWQMFSVITRKVYFLDFFVWWSWSIHNNIDVLQTTWWVFSTDKKIKANMKDENLLLWFKIKNNGNVTQNIDIVGKVYNILWFEKSYEKRQINIKPGEVKDIDLDVWIVPAYKWFFTVKYSIQNTPVFPFDTSNMDQKITKWWEITNKATVFIFSWVAVIVMILMVLILIKLFMPRKKVVVQS